VFSTAYKSRLLSLVELCGYRSYIFRYNFRRAPSEGLQNGRFERADPLQLRQRVAVPRSFRQVQSGRRLAVPRRERLLLTILRGTQGELLRNLQPRGGSSFRQFLYSLGPTSIATGGILTSQKPEVQYRHSG